jgi:ABC-type multidrug transport system ATPase subunit
MTEILRTERVVKQYGKFRALDEVSVSIPRGSVYGLLGPNGAGKSTLIKSICGLLRFNGSVNVGGYENTTAEAKRLLGYVPEFPALYPMLTVKEHLEFIAKAYKLEQWTDYAEELLNRFELDDKKNKLGKELSKGMQQKTSICCALLPKPKAIILDEPLVGLDPHGIRELKTMISDLKETGCALLVSTHMIDSVEENWDVTYIMQRGKIVHKCHRTDIAGIESLESIYFKITENGTKG